MLIAFDFQSIGSKKEQLLLSVLPEHVAVKMRQDLGTAHDGQFKKIYMSRHENVRLVDIILKGSSQIKVGVQSNLHLHCISPELTLVMGTLPINTIQRIDFFFSQPRWLVEKFRIPSFLAAVWWPKKSDAACHSLVMI